MQTRSDIGKSRYQKMREKNQKMHLKMENKVYNWPKPNKKYLCGQITTIYDSPS